MIHYNLFLTTSRKEIHSVKILAVDNEVPALNILSRAILEAQPDADLRSYQRISDVIRAVRMEGFRPDVAFLDIEMPGMSGLELASVIKITYPNVNIIFVTGYSSYALDAMALRPSGYILKPATREKIQIEFENLRNPPARTVPPKAMRVQCFGSFEVFLNEKPLKFSRLKSKELLAYLIDRRGAGSTSSEIAAVLWEDDVYDRSRQKQLSVIRLELMKSLKEIGYEHIIIKNRDAMAVDITAFDCDYYMALDGDSVAVNAFMGEYMMPYSWAEMTTGALTMKFRSL